MAPQLLGESCAEPSVWAEESSAVPCQALRHCVCQTEPLQLSRFGMHS